MNQESAEDGQAVCQQCGGDVHLEVDFSPAGQDFRVYAECRDCYESGWKKPSGIA